MAKKNPAWSVGYDRYKLKDSLFVEIGGFYVVVDLFDGTQTQFFTRVGKAMDHYEKLKARKYEEAE